MTTPRIRLPQSARPGEAIEVRTLISHPMVTAVSGPGPRDMLARFETFVNGATAFAYDFGNGSSANPTFTFHLRLQETAEVRFVWTHEDGRQFETAQTVTIG